MNKLQEAILRQKFNLETASKKIEQQDYVDRYAQGTPGIQPDLPEDSGKIGTFFGAAGRTFGEAVSGAKYVGGSLINKESDLYRSLSMTENQKSLANKIVANREINSRLNLIRQQKEAVTSMNELDALLFHIIKE